jgi:hypothetical protein
MGEKAVIAERAAMLPADRDRISLTLIRAALAAD